MNVVSVCVHDIDSRCVILTGCMSGINSVGVCVRGRTISRSWGHSAARSMSE